MGQQILVVDDDKSMREMLQSFLIREGYSVDTANGVVSALDAIASNEYDIMLFDKNMPGIYGEIDGGIELLRYVSALPTRPTVIMMTGNPTVASSVEAKNLGAVDFIYKPFSLMDLGRRIKKALM
ncbi:MAG: response regulator [Syntrophobacteraceae bacterium]